MTREMLAALSITIVAHGSTHDPNDDDGRDPYEVPKAMGIFHELPSSVPLTVDSIVARIRANHEKMAAKVERKMAAEREYYENRCTAGGDASPASTRALSSCPDALRGS
jgi:ethanolamine-phosphate cytidylyltransferase